MDKLIKRKQVKVYKHLEEWSSVDTYKDLLNLKKALKFNPFGKTGKFFFTQINYCRNFNKMKSSC